MDMGGANGCIQHTRMSRTTFSSSISAYPAAGVDMHARSVSMNVQPCQLPCDEKSGYECYEVPQQVDEDLQAEGTEAVAPVARAVQVTWVDQPWPLQVAGPQPGQPGQQLPAVQPLAALLHAGRPACNEGREQALRKRPLQLLPMRLCSAKLPRRSTVSHSPASTHRDRATPGKHVLSTCCAAIWASASSASWAGAMNWPLLAARVAPMTFWKEGWGSVRIDAACPARISSCISQEVIARCSD